MSSEAAWVVLPLNPQPWVTPPSSPARKGGKLYVQVGRDEQLANYKEAVTELARRFVIDNPELDAIFPMTGKIRLTFFFWRQITEYKTESSATQRKHEADTTNLQKATEDALQGVFYENDKDVWDVRSVICDQSPAAKPCVVIKVEPYSQIEVGRDVPPDVYNLIVEAQNPRDTSESNSWPPKGL